MKMDLSILAVMQSRDLDCCEVVRLGNTDTGRVLEVCRDQLVPGEREAKSQSPISGRSPLYLHQQPRWPKATHTPRRQQSGGYRKSCHCDEPGWLRAGLWMATCLIWDPGAPPRPGLGRRDCGDWPAEGGQPALVVLRGNFQWSGLVGITVQETQGVLPR